MRRSISYERKMDAATNRQSFEAKGIPWQLAGNFTSNFIRELIDEIDE